MHTITDHIKDLEQLIASEIQKANFYPGVDAKEIAKFENENEIQLLTDYALFLKHFNGGYITEYNWPFYTDMTEDEPDGPRYSSFNFFSLDELAYEYVQLKLNNDWMYEAYGDEFVFPIIPIAQTPSQKLLFLLSEGDMDKNSALFLASKEDLRLDVFRVADGFDSFLSDYIIAKGFPNLKENAVVCKLKDYMD